MDLLADRAELIELLGRYADMADQRDFRHPPRLIFTDPCTFDFESVTGFPRTTMPLSAFLEGTRRGFAPYAATHHAITGHVVEVDGDRATIHAHVRAEHWLPPQRASSGPDCWLVVGFYDNEAVRTSDGWRLDLVRLTATYQGNPELSSSALLS